MTDNSTASQDVATKPTDGAKKPPSNLAIRLLTAGIAGPLILLLLYLGPAWAWLVFIAFAAAIGAFEFFGMVHKGDTVSVAAGVLLSLVVLLTLWFDGKNPAVLVTLMMLLPIVAISIALARLGPMETAAVRLTSSVFGPIYLGAGMAAIAMLKRDAGSDGPGFVVLTLMLSWMSDTGAYFAGRFLGKRKLYEAVSPKKTVAGALGGLAAATAGALAGSFFYLRSLPPLHAVGFGVIAGALGQMGDLGESLLKRSVGVKDSGGIVPGHGGILDRVDALLVTASLAYVYVLFIR